MATFFFFNFEHCREVVANTFKWDENSRTQDLRSDMIEMTEPNRKRVNLRHVGAVGEGFSGTFADDPRRSRIRGNEVEPITET